MLLSICSKNTCAFEFACIFRHNIKCSLITIITIILNIVCWQCWQVLTEAYSAAIQAIATLTSPAAEAAAAIAAAESARVTSHEANNVVAVIAGAAAAVVAVTVAASTTAQAAATRLAADRAKQTAEASPEDRLEQCTVAGRTASCIRYDFSVQPVSVHQPVSRLFAGLCACCNMASLSLIQLQVTASHLLDVSVVIWWVCHWYSYR